MIKKITLFISSVSAIVAVLMVAPVALPASAQNDANAQAVCEGAGGTWNTGTQVCSSPSGRTVPGTIRNITNTIIFVAGAIAVLMIIIGGVRYVLSAGDQAATTAAKNTILYAVVGVIVVFMAYAIVNFVIDNI